MTIIATVTRGGSLTLVQDLGRVAYRHCGVPPAGAMDPWAARAANRLVGNADAAAVLEITMQGPDLHFTQEALVAITGSRLRQTHQESFWVRAGTKLSLGPTRDGARAYMAVAGGWDVPLVLGSRATFSSGGWGGYQGRGLQAGDTLATMAPPSQRPPRRRLSNRVLPAYDGTFCLRFLKGPQWESFSAVNQQAFVSESYEVSQQANRMGLRLRGLALTNSGDADILPEGLVTGAVQVPADGQAIILGVDLPCTGGYRKIATVIGADWPLLAYAKPGDCVRFVACDLEEARAAYWERERMLQHGIEEINDHDQNRSERGRG